MFDRVHQWSQLGLEFSLWEVLSYKFNFFNRSRTRLSNSSSVNFGNCVFQEFSPFYLSSWIHFSAFKCNTVIQGLFLTIPLISLGSLVVTLLSFLILVIDVFSLFPLIKSVNNLTDLFKERACSFIIFFLLFVYFLFHFCF